MSGVRKTVEWWKDCCRRLFGVFWSLLFFFGPVNGPVPVCFYLSLNGFVVVVVVGTEVKVGGGVGKW